MKKYYELLCVLFGWLVYATSVNAQSPNLASEEKTVSNVEGRTVYALVTNDPTLGGYGVTTFKTDVPSDMTLLHKWGNGLFIYGGAAAHGEYYGHLYRFDNSGGGRVFSLALSKINLRTGKIEYVKDWSDVIVKLQDMTFDYSTNTMYGVGFDLGKSNLYIVDLQTGDITTGPTLKTNTGNQIIATLAATYDGRLYGMNLKGDIYQVDKETGGLIYVMATGVSLGFNQSMEFDHTDESLYWATMVGGKDSTNELYKIDVNKKTTKSLGQLGGGRYTQACGLYVPFVLAGFDAPGQVTDLKAVPAEKGVLEAVITWKNSVKTHGGGDLSGNVNMVLERNGEVIGSSFGEVGAEMSWTDKAIKKMGEHVYTVKPNNEIGEGTRADFNVYVGNDVPAPTADLITTVGGECKSIKLSWSIPEHGAHGGYYDKSNVKFKIVRYPDRTILKEAYQGDTYEDKTINRLGAYYYGITAFNEAGANEEYIRNSVVVAGKPIDIPYDCGFENETVAKNQWSVVDGNEDGNTWCVNSGLSNVIFGDYSIAAEYITDVMSDSRPNANEWLISPPFNFEADKKYYMSFDIRSAGTEELNITFGDLNTPDSQNQMIESGFFTEEADKSNPEFKTCTFQLPKAEGVHCVGFNLVTLFGNSFMFQMNNFVIDEGVVTGTGSVVVGEKAKICLDGDRLIVKGDFKITDIYDTTGVCVVTLNEANAEVVTADWHPGLYIVKVVSAGSVYIQKVIIK